MRLHGRLRTLQAEQWMKIKDVMPFPRTTQCYRGRRLECLKSDVNQLYDNPFSTIHCYLSMKVDWIDVTTEQCLWDMKMSLRYFTERQYFTYSRERCLWFRLQLTLTKARVGIQFILKSVRRPWPQVRRRVSCRAPATDSRRLAKSWADLAGDRTSLRLRLSRSASAARTSYPAKNLVWPRKMRVN